MFKVERLGTWGVIILTTIYLILINTFFEYVINREVNSTIQIVVALIALAYTIFTLKLIVNLVYNFIKKEEKND
jgi:undecaprenyl pyrophosphate phosphatase UppP